MRPNNNGTSSVRLHANTNLTGAKNLTTMVNQTSALKLLPLHEVIMS
ncbi:hypothetical protein AB0757_09340 [Scytonema millei VB511283_2]